MFVCFTICLNIKKGLSTFLEKDIPDNWEEQQAKAAQLLLKGTNEAYGSRLTRGLIWRSPHF